MVNEPNLDEFKIKKTTYKFTQIKKYQPKMHFIIKKSKKKLIDEILELITPKSKTQSAKTTAYLKQKKALDIKILGAGAIIFLVILVLIFSLFGSFSAEQEKPQAQALASFSGDIKYNVIDSGVLSYGGQADHKYQAYIILDQKAQNLSSLKLIAKLYYEDLPKQVFILDYYRDGADTYPEFRKRFQAYMEHYGWVVNDITLEDLKNLPPQSTILILTGYLPKKLLGNEDFPSIVDLAKKGNTIIYLGQPFDKVLNEVGSIEKADAQKVSQLGIKFETKTKLASAENFSMQSPYYAASYQERQPNLIWGSISLINLPNNGYILILPQALDGGWAANPYLAAADIARLVNSQPHILPISVVEKEISLQNQTNRITLFFDPMQTTRAFGRITFKMVDKKNNTKYEFFDWPFYTTTNSDLYVEDSIFVPTYLGGTRKVITLNLNENPLREVKLSYEVYKDGVLLQSFPIEQGLTPTIVTRATPVAFSLEPGDYILKVRDSNGNYYAGAKIKIKELDVDIKGVSTSSGFKEGKFNITFYSQNNKVVVPYVKIYVENKRDAPVKEYKNVEQVFYETPTNFQRGEYTFVFDFGGYIKRITKKYDVSLDLWERTDMQILGLLNIIVFIAIAYALTRPKKELFALDIPDFPFQEYKEIRLKPSQIIEVFEIVNREYRWDRMPLSSSEIKDGFLKLTLDGNPIVIGEYNLEKILDRMVEKNLLKTKFGYWIPTKWVEETYNNQSTKILMYRFLRDIFVNNAIKFSKLKITEGYDIKILINQTIYYLYIFDRDYSFIKNSILKANETTCWIIFESQEQQQEFLEEISNGTSKAFLLFKLYLNSDKIKLITADSIEEYIKHLKI
jgi:hypothetical protein